jgi:hypothetical protein
LQHLVARRVAVGDRLRGGEVLRRVVDESGRDAGMTFTWKLNVPEVAAGTEAMIAVTRPRVVML